ncbi:hypothetical protein [Paeniglutamicibacter psychrophenolicus]|nr:hypothetical protein [Paeniglutamicibacter psychrophenolicus]MDQ0093598.1 hypothetical protein [Paeniglutamicibacter psychrophenolicus]
MVVPLPPLVPCWWARLIVGSTDTSSSISPRLSAGPNSVASTESHVPSAA